MSDDTYSGRAYFGAASPFAWTQELPVVDVPVGEHCLWCDEQIDMDDAGVLTPFVSMSDEGPVGSIRAMHLECEMRSVLGSAAHIAGRCSCFVEDASETDDPALTRRQAAIVAYEMVVLNRGLD